MKWPFQPPKPPPRRRGLGKKTLARIAAEQSQNGEKSLSIKSPSTTRPAAIRLSKRDYKQVVGIGGINSDWALTGLSEDADVWQNIFALRSRSRDLFRTDVYFQKYGEELWANVFGAEGITCRLRVKETEDRVVYAPDEIKYLKAYHARRDRVAKWLRARKCIPETSFGTRAERFLRSINERAGATIQVGDLDLRANMLIEKAWEKWKRREYCTVSGVLSYNEVCQIRLLSCARDGDYFLRHVKDPSINEYGYSLQLINAEWCDYTLNTKLDNGNEIRMGIERNKFGKRVAYYFVKRTPMDWQFGTPGFGQTGGPKTYTRIPAEEIIHYARYKDGDNTRPAPWSAPVIIKSRHLDKYEEAEVVAARVSACKMGFFTSTVVPEGGEIQADRPDPTQEGTIDAEPGSWQGLKWGIDVKESNPTHPNGNFDLFRKGMLRAWCAGMPGANYNIIANDLEGVNYSSGRLGMLDERELWKLIQKFDIEIAERPIFEAWLEMSLMTGAIPLPLAKFDKFNQPIFRGRRWAWVDPQKEVDANASQVENKFISRTRVIEDSDVDADFEQIIFELAEEEMMMEELGLTVQPMKQQPQGKNGSKPNGSEEEEETPARKEMNRMEIVELIRATQPKQPSITVHVPEPVVNIKELKTDIVIPEQKAPVVHVTHKAAEVKAPDVVVNVAPAAVTVKNDIRIPKTKSVTIRRGDDGKPTGLDIEKE